MCRACTPGVPYTYTAYRGTPGYNLTSKRLEPNVLSKNCAAVLNQIDVKAHKEAHGKVAASILAVTAHPP